MDVLGVLTTLNFKVLTFENLSLLLVVSCSCCLYDPQMLNIQAIGQHNPGSVYLTQIVQWPYRADRPADFLKQSKVARSQSTKIRWSASGILPLQWTLAFDTMFRGSQTSDKS
jgi:hypothetical protein